MSVVLQHTLSARDLERCLLPMLAGRVFHVTSRVAYQGICRDSLIKSNRDAGSPFSSSQSEISCFRRMGHVSVCDLRSATSEEVETGLHNYNFLNPPNADNAPVFLILSEAAVVSLVSWKACTYDGPYGTMVVPHIEAGYPDSIPLSLIDQVIMVTVEPTPAGPHLAALLLQSTARGVTGGSSDSGVAGQPPNQTSANNRLPLNGLRRSAAGRRQDLP